MININNLTKIYGTTTAVNNITFEIKKGEILGFLGPNGAGKTTTVRIITCFLQPTSGSVDVDGMDVTERSLEVRRKIGYLPENSPLYHDMTVYEFLQFVSEMREIPVDNRSSRMKRMVEVAGLGDVLGKNIGALSKGYRQRVGLAQALIHDPEIVILDEPTSGLDPNQIVEIRNLIKELGREKTVVLCTHILSEVQATCDRAIIINKGNIVANGTIAEIESSAKSGESVILELKAADGDPITSLNAIEGVDEVATIPSAGSSKSFRLEIMKGSDPREEIFRKIVDSGWSILEMRREKTSLEEVFRNLTMN